MATWKLIVEIAMPIPCVLLTLLLAPTPRSFHRGVLRLVERTLGVRVIGGLRLLHFFLIITGLAFLSTIRTTLSLAEKSDIPLIGDASPNMEISRLAKKWRAERNFWISFMSFVLWCLLARLYQVLKHNALLEDGVEGRARPVAALPASGAATQTVVPKRTPKEQTQGSAKVMEMQDVPITQNPIRQADFAAPKTNVVAAEPKKQI